MKNKLISLLMAICVFCIATLPAVAETNTATPDSVSFVKSDSGVYLDEVYTVPLDTDLASLQKEKIDQDGITYLFDFVTSEKVAGEVTEMSVRQMVFVLDENDDLAAVQAAQPKNIPYNKDGFVGTLHLDTTATEMSGPVLRDAAWQGGNVDAVFTAVWVSEPGNASGIGGTKREYEYRFWYTGTVTHSEPDMLRVTVRYRAQADAKKSVFPFSFPAFSLPAITLPEWLPGGLAMILPAAGLASLVILVLVGLCVLRRRNRADPSDQVDATEMAAETDKRMPVERFKKTKKLVWSPKASKDTKAEDQVAEDRPPMPVPKFIDNMDRGGTDTLDEDGGEQYGQRV